MILTIALVWAGVCGAILGLVIAGKLEDKRRERATWERKLERAVERWAKDTARRRGR